MLSPLLPPTIGSKPSFTSRDERFISPPAPAPMYLIGEMLPSKVPGLEVAVVAVGVVA